MSSLDTKKALVKVSLHVIKNSTMWNVKSINKVPNIFALIEADWVFILGYFFWWRAFRK